MAAAAAVLSALASTLAALALLWSVWTHREVKTANGKTIGMLADIAQGRDIERNVKPEDRTSSQVAYVERANEPEHG